MSMMDGVHVQWTARFDYEPGKKLQPHRHDCWQMIWIAEGEGFFHSDAEVYPLRANTLCFIHPNRRHGLSASRTCAVKTLDIKFELADDKLIAILSKLPGCMDNPSLKVGELLETIRQEGLQKRPFYRELANLKLAEGLYKLARIYVNGEGGGRSRIQREKGLSSSEEKSRLQVDLPHTAAKEAAWWIEEHPGEEATVLDLATRLGYSASHLRKVFKEAYGITMPRFQQKLRIKRAKKELAYSNATLYQIAAESGFKTTAHFCRVFKQHEGITPRQWASREKQGIRRESTLPIHEMTETDLEFRNAVSSLDLVYFGTEATPIGTLYIHDVSVIR